MARNTKYRRVSPVVSPARDYTKPGGFFVNGKLRFRSFSCRADCYSVLEDVENVSTSKQARRTGGEIDDIETDVRIMGDMFTSSLTKAVSMLHSKEISHNMKILHHLKEIAELSMGRDCITEIEERIENLKNLEVVIAGNQA